MMDTIARSIRQFVRVVMEMPANTVRPAQQLLPAGAANDEIATVMVMSGAQRGRVGVTQDLVGPVTYENVDALRELVASVQFYRSRRGAADLRGGPASADVDDYTGVVAGGFDVSIDGTNLQVAGLDFSGAADLDAVAALLQAALHALLAGVTCVWTGKRFVITSPSSGRTSAVLAAVAPTGAGPPAPVGALLALTAAAGASPSDNTNGIPRPSLDAFERALELVQRIELASSVDLMQQLGIMVTEVGKPRNLTALADSLWESRGQVDLSFCVVSRVRTEIGTFVAPAKPSQVPVGLQVQQPGGAIQTRTFEE